MEAVLYFQRTLKKESRAFRSIGNNNYYILDKLDFLKKEEETYARNDEYLCRKLP